MIRAGEDHHSRRFVGDLLSYMTLDEKLGQLDLFHAPDDPALEQAIVAGQVGGIASGVHADRWQGLATERSRLGIPLLLSCAAGPSPVGPWALAASWDEELAMALGTAAAREAIDRGCNALRGPRFATADTPMADRLDLAACDPHLVARLAGAFCRGAAGTPDEPRGAALAIAQEVDGRGAAREMAQAGDAAALDAGSLTPAAAETMGFSGILIAECARIRALIARQFASTRARSRLEAAEAAVAEGQLHEDEIAAAVRGVLTAKHGLALFRDPQRLLPASASIPGFDRPADHLRHTMVLLRNESGLLPLSPVSDRVLLIGPADGTAQACAEALIRAGIEHSAAPGLATRRPGESWTMPAAGDHFALALTRDAAKRADFALVVLEPRHFQAQAAGGWQIAGPAVMALLKALAPVGTRLVALVATPEPVDLAEADQHFAAVLQCWAAGPGFEEALGDILSGRCGPQGRMPASAGRYAFGSGLGYGETSLGSLTLTTGGDHLTACVRIANSGSFTTRETVQLYVRQADGSQRLATYQHVALAPGDAADLRFDLGLEALGRLGESERLELAPGRCEILVGKDARRLLSAAVEIAPALARAIVNRDRGFLRLAG